MLHCTFLPYMDQWRHFIKALKFVVVDGKFLFYTWKFFCRMFSHRDLSISVELHVYNSLFGSHVAYIMRRLIRICENYGNSSMRFVSCSATIGNPDEVGY